MYIIVVDGFAISTPMTLQDIINAFGPVNKLEAKGYRLRRVS